jgi:methyltransferase family protein
MFERAEWQRDRMTLDGLLFRIEQQRTDDWNAGDDHFRFYKGRPLVAEYEAFFRRWAISPRNIFEIGLWDGGSLAFWFAAFNPERIVGVDIEDREDSAYFRRFVAERNLHSRIRTHWRTNQADAAALRRIVRDDFDGPLDLVFDDASHLYTPTKSSFETLFPLVRPGGLYIIEDWAWNHWRDFRRPQNWSPDEHLSRLAFELVEATATNRGLVARVSIEPGFIAIERGPAEAMHFRLADHIYRQNPSRLDRLTTRILWGPERDYLSKTLRRFRP